MPAVDPAYGFDPTAAAAADERPLEPEFATAGGGGGGGGGGGFSRRIFFLATAAAAAAAAASGVEGQEDRRVDAEPPQARRNRGQMGLVQSSDLVGGGEGRGGQGGNQECVFSAGKRRI